MPMTIRSAGFVIFRRFSDKEDADLPEYLLLQASYGEFHWSPPKGEVEYFEPDYLAAVRETREETGLTSENLKMGFDISQTIDYVNRKGRKKKAIYYLAELLNDVPIVLSDEHQIYKWFPAEEARSICLYQDLSKVIDNFETFIKKGEWDYIYGDVNHGAKPDVDYEKYNFDCPTCGPQPEAPTTEITGA
ncbi:bis(5'-nucleosyl)-tetraphosphatase [asymmetrical]-like [Macrosteles quadrilineatus]|uniref:bis(5'-nucleosyl)-tetraphosphatase [asymmetrical]-like n=1 Tax=Macrosteles quadrilineatus TaxID=74068 RepID=UPI0023E33CDE|nr:bis(5'-nucleosyl)-tetraphosphatase [asymmetrical]-like [Macrosteles quadrilineatus]